VLGTGDDRRRVVLSFPGQSHPDTLLDLVLGPVIERPSMTFPSLDAYREHLAESPYFEMGPIAERYLVLRQPRFAS
jgi:hypothetical protein